MEDRRYDGLTVAEWRERIKSLRFDDPAATQAVPGLLALVRDEDLPWFTRRQAALTLGRIGEPAKAAVPALTELLAQPTSDDESPPQWAAKALALFGPVAAPATGALIAVLEDQQRSHVDRLTTIEALARIGGAHPDAIGALIRLIQTEPGDDYNAATRREAGVDALALVGGPASPAVPTLIRLTREGSGPLRKKAAVTLGAIGPSAAIAAEALAELVVFDELGEVRDAAALSLAQIGDPGESVLRHLLADEDAQVRRRAAAALGQTSSRDEETVSTLATALDDSDADVRITAAESLWALTSDASTVLPTILHELTSADRQIRIRAYRLLLKLGPAAEPAFRELRRLAEDERPHVRQAAQKALDELSGASGR